MPSNSRKQLEQWLKTIEVRGGKVLDVGGSQKSIEGRLKKFEPDEYEILDLERPHKCERKPDMIADINKPIGIVKELTPEGEYVKDVMSDNFDVVFCLEVMEYVWDPVTALRNLNRFLKKDGLLYISFHFLYSVHNPLGEDCLRYTKFGVEKLLEKTGFEILEMVPRRLSEGGARAYLDMLNVEGMRPSKEFTEHNVSGYLVKAKKIS